VVVATRDAQAASVIRVVSNGPGSPVASIGCLLPLHSPQDPGQFFGVQQCELDEQLGTLAYPSGDLARSDRLDVGVGDGGPHLGVEDLHSGPAVRQHDDLAVQGPPDLLGDAVTGIVVVSGETGVF
jgi:hypothetical protein